MLPLELLVSDGTFFVDDVGWDVRAGFVFDVDDAWFLVASQCHFLMASGQHVEGECFFCVTVTRAVTRYNVGKECFRQTRHSQLGKMIGVPSSPMNM